MQAVHVPGLSFSSEDYTPGHFDVRTEPSGQRRMWYVCPGCKVLGALALRPVVDGSPQSWEWDGSLERPTLTPSINHVGCWHGWLRAGEFVLA